ncbi:oligopeptide:H+ symporter [Fulvivirgaceae bacterium BMA10]|uniref:Oligopeptide:H+ symporter n=1 Tax=Splendidivirga corallicola TaxID=3051826 RepID=A0ABT8KY62_9BACT|nr:oligopeptide:H+ symporter [Fulvivirgaceae bacterium BMA10]
MSEIDQTSSPSQAQMFGHPKGLFYLFFAELWERFSFYGMRALLTLYMVDEIFKSFETRDTIATTIYAAYGAFVYATPVVGGILADRLLGYRRAIILGGILMALGHFVLAFENKILFFGALSLIIAGNGLFKPNISSFVGALYKQGDRRRDVGFTIFYMGINLGAAVAPLFCGWLGKEFGWHYGFGAAGIGMVLGLLVFWNGLKSNTFGAEGLPPEPEKLNNRKFGIKLKHLVPILTFLCVPVIALMMYYGPLTIPGIGIVDYKGEAVSYLFYVILAVILYVVIKTLAEVSKVERERLIVVVLLTFFITLFWAFYELSGSTLTLFAQRNVNLFIINASQTNFLTAGFIVVLALPFSALWNYLTRIKRNPYTPYKFAIGLTILALGYVIYASSAGFADEQGRVPFAFMFFGYMLFSTGELFMSPVGLSKVTELSPKKIVSFMMGVWFLAVSFAFRLIGFIGNKLAIEGSADAELDTVQSLSVYTNGFQQIAMVTVGGAILAFIMAPIMKKWMHGIH